MDDGDAVSARAVRRIRRVLMGVGITGALFASVTGALFLCVPGVPDEAAVLPYGVVLRDAAGEVLRVTLGKDDVDCRPGYQADARDWIVRAVVAAEDGEFWRHAGVRPLSVLRALGQNIRARRRVSGASTLTMQAVRLMAPHPKNILWKAIEAVQAIKLERRHDKLWILTQYLNRAPFGSNFVGVEAAAQGWFGKRAKDLGPGEAALLAGLVQAPNRYRPDRHLDRALARRDYVLARMEKTGVLTADEHRAACQVVPAINRVRRPFSVPFFCDWVQAASPCVADGGDFTTTLDPELQPRVARAVDEAARAGGWHVAAVVMRVARNEVVALACSGDYLRDPAGQVNTANAPRPAGSTLKPFLLAQAFDHAQATPDERLRDRPRTFQGYCPANFNGGYRGLVSAREALQLSLNLPFVELLQRVGVTPFADTLRGMGFACLGACDEDLGLGLAIGNAQTTLIELTNAYATFAREGLYAPPRVFASDTPPTTVRCFSSGAAYLISDILSGSARSAASLGHTLDVTTPRFAWKTGTSAAYRDAWTVAWNPEYVVGVWCGHLQGGFGDASLVGIKAAAPVAWKIARGLYPGGRGPWFARPDTVGRRRVCALSGQCANPDCPETFEADYLPRYSATTLCRMHVRDAAGACVVLRDVLGVGPAETPSQSSALAILKPSEGAVFHTVPDALTQGVVCTVTGNGSEERLWWFADGIPVGETCGSSPFVWNPVPGEHELSCTTLAGATAQVHVRVTRSN